MKSKRALIVVDCQNDFASPNGALSVDGAQDIMPKIAELIEEVSDQPDYWIVVVTQDSHPENHCSFKENGGMWPTHCVEGTWGYQLDPLIDKALSNVESGNLYMVHKAVDPSKDAYSGFDGTDLEIALCKEGIDEIWVVGLTTDYCVRATALDALKIAPTVVCVDCIKHVAPDTGLEAIFDLVKSGAELSAFRMSDN